MGLKILGKVGAHIFLFLFFSRKENNNMHFERHLAFQNAYNYIIFQKT